LIPFNQIEQSPNSTTILRKGYFYLGEWYAHLEGYTYLGQGYTYLGEGSIYLVEGYTYLWKGYIFIWEKSIYIEFGRRVYTTIHIYTLVTIDLYTFKKCIIHNYTSLRGAYLFEERPYLFGRMYTGTYFCSRTKTLFNNSLINHKDLKAYQVTEEYRSWSTRNICLITLFSWSIVILLKTIVVQHCTMYLNI